MISLTGKTIKAYDTTDISANRQTCWTLRMMAVIQYQRRNKKRLPLPDLGEGKGNRSGVHPCYFKECAKSGHKEDIYSYLL